MCDENKCHDLLATLDICTQAIVSANELLTTAGVLHEESFDWEKYDKVMAGLSRGNYTLQKHRIHKDIN